ncbi:hypothetical protein AZSI13_07310 [Azospira sp. I13]|uniref:YceI family protein n=1 Tax=Azospira sp. I13 TaxID=1765050 RepID=UPI000D3FEA69|nr:YceI family protein [Azospira sp. I13]GBG01404.1 hypothetical protein AZSI13_07310 [Azospira sp. I13]
MIKQTLSAAALAAAFIALPAQAVEYGTVQVEKTQVAFTYKQMNVPIDGKFKKTAASIAFDPAKPQAAKATLEIDLASIDAGSQEANDEVAGKLWFNTKAFPKATFVSSGVKALGNNRFEVAGKLTIKGKTQDATAPFTFKQDGANGVFDGTFTLKRADFAIGEGMWADFGTVANEIQIKFHVVAAPAAAAKK